MLWNLISGILCKHRLQTSLSSQGIGIAMDNHDFIITLVLCQIIMASVKPFPNMLKSPLVSFFDEA